MILHGLTAIFIIAKLFDQVDWSWWLVLSPSLFKFAAMIAFVIAGAYLYSNKNRNL